MDSGIANHSLATRFVRLRRATNSSRNRTMKRFDFRTSKERLDEQGELPDRLDAK